MKKILARLNEFLKYKSFYPVLPGEYFIIENTKFDYNQKQVFKPIACIDKNKKFFWLLPAENWIERLLETKNISRNIYPNFNEYFNFPKSIRNWQTKVLQECYSSLVETKEFKKGIIAPLGSGKTLLGLIISQIGDALVCCQRHLFETWRSEAKKWKFKCPTLSTYESIQKQKKEFEIIILDEVLAVKNPEAQRTKEVRRKTSKAKIVLGFTGTPTGAKQISDLRWLNSIVHQALPDTERQIMFMWGNPELEEFPGGRAYKATKWEFDMVSKFTGDYITSVDIKEIEKELPEISYQKIYLDQPKEFNTIKNGFYSDNVMKTVAQCRQSSDGFIYSVEEKPIEFDRNKIEAIKNIFENLGEPIVVYTNWNASLQALKKEFPDSSLLSGDTKNPQAEIEKFKQGETKILLANTRISTGMNLQEQCRVMIFMSNSANPIDRTQAEGRIYRPGQKKAVQIIDLIAKDTLDERQLELIKKYSSVSENYILKLLQEELKI